MRATAHTHTAADKFVNLRHDSWNLSVLLTQTLPGYFYRRSFVNQVRWRQSFAASVCSLRHTSKILLKNSKVCFYLPCNWHFKIFHANQLVSFSRPISEGVRQLEHFFSLLQWNESAIAAWPILPYAFCHLCVRRSREISSGHFVSLWPLTNEFFNIIFFGCCLRCSRRVSRVWACANHLFILFRILFSPRKTKREKISGFTCLQSHSIAVRLKRHRQQFARWTSAKPTCTLMDIASGAHTSQTDSLKRHKFPACR